MAPEERERVKGIGISSAAREELRQIVAQETSVLVMEVAGLFADAASYLAHRARREADLLEDLAAYFERRSQGEAAQLDAALEADPDPEAEP